MHNVLEKVYLVYEEQKQIKTKLNVVMRLNGGQKRVKVGGKPREVNNNGNRLRSCFCVLG